MDNAVPQLQPCVEAAHLRVVQDQIGIVTASDQGGAREPLRAPPAAELDVDLDQPHVVGIRLGFFVDVTDAR